MGTGLSPPLASLDRVFHPQSHSWGAHEFRTPVSSVASNFTSQAGRITQFLLTISHPLYAHCPHLLWHREKYTHVHTPHTYPSHDDCGSSSTLLIFQKPLLGGNAFCSSAPGLLTLSPLRTAGPRAGEPGVSADQRFQPELLHRDKSNAVDVYSIILNGGKISTPNLDPKVFL